MKLHFKQNSAAIILRSFLAMLIVITVLSSVMTVLATGHQLLVNTSINSTNIVHSLKKNATSTAMMTGKIGVSTAP